MRVLSSNLWELARIGARRVINKMRHLSSENKARVEAPIKQG